MEIMEHGIISKIANTAGLNYSTVWNYCRRPPKSMPLDTAIMLEEASGVDKLIWLKGDPAEIQAALEASKLNF